MKSKNNSYNPKVVTVVFLVILIGLISVKGYSYFDNREEQANLLVESQLEFLESRDEIDKVEYRQRVRTGVLFINHSYNSYLAVVDDEVRYVRVDDESIDNMYSYSIR